MAYISNNDIQTRLGSAVYVQLTDDAGTGSANEAVVDEARAGAEGEVDGYLARRYSVPIDLVTHPELAGLLKSITLDLAEYRLRLRRPPVSDEAVQRRKQATAWLQKVASQDVDLPAKTEPAPSERSALKGRVLGSARVLDREEFSDF